MNEQTFYSLDQEAAVLRIDGEITDSRDWWTDTAGAKEFRRALARLDGRALTVEINSPGGDVFAAASIYTALKEYPGDVTVKILGLAASAASVIAMAGDRILISPVAYIMIHNPWTITMGDRREHEHAAQVLQELTEGLIAAYQAKTGLDRDTIIGYMDAETYMSAASAVENGFADAILFAPDDDEDPDDDDLDDDDRERTGVRTMMRAAAYTGQRYAAMMTGPSPAPDPEEPEATPEAEADEAEARARIRAQAQAAAAMRY